MTDETDRLAHFMNGFAAAAQLGRRAAVSGFVIEFVILAASIIDGALRIGLALQHQIDTESSECRKSLRISETKTKRCRSGRSIAVLLRDR